MQEGEPYIKDTGDFLDKTRNINAIPENAILVTADVIGLYQSIPHQAGLEALRETLDKRKTHKVPMNKLAEYVLKRQSMYSKTITFSFRIKCINKFQEQQ